ncbi:SMP-30/gluconolactonase/LRE family protein [Devosia chinhatensis]|uniref:SMP-30/gluconolactonase/LRE family protein n=1 Tax=Devosia aurantiaca TaxID=2714858 RepID=A0A6M1SDK4_9HYPH|nr:SMP-30/gluconolactonase/LRE family protein [Devosia aurantiaca]
MTQTAQLLVDSQCALGEGPVWHVERQQLFWVDINNKELFAASADGEIQQSWAFDEMMAAIAIVDRDTLVLVGETGLKRLDLQSGAVEHFFDLERDVPTNRGNDSRVHPSGAFWIGTMVKDEGPKDGAVYHYLAGKLQRISPMPPFRTRRASLLMVAAPIGPTPRPVAS